MSPTSVCPWPTRTNASATTSQGEVTDDLIPTGMEHLDRILKGLGPGELGLFMAPTGGGKSFALVNVGLNAGRE